VYRHKNGSGGKRFSQLISRCWSNVAHWEPDAAKISVGQLASPGSGARGAHETTRNFLSHMKRREIVHAPNKVRVTTTELPQLLSQMLVHGQVTIIFVVSVRLSVCLSVCTVQSFTQPSLIRFGSN